MGYLISVEYEPKTNKAPVKKDKEYVDALYQKLNAARRAGDTNRVKKLDDELVRVYRFAKGCY